MSLNLDKSNWKYVAFGDVVASLNITVKDPETAGIDRVIAMEHLDPSELKIRRWGSLEDGTTFTRRVRPGQTLFGKRRAYQRKAAYAEFDAICSSDILVFEADKNRLLPKFLPFIVQSSGFYDHALSTSAGSLSPRTNWRDLADYEFDLPPLDEQKRLADLLWAFEQHRQSLGDVTEQCSVVREAFIRYEFADGDVPMVPLTDAALITSGVTLGPGRNAMNLKVPYLRVANVHRNRFDLAEIKEVGATPEEVASKSVQRGDVLVVEGHASTSEVGRAAMWDMPETLLIQNHLFRVRSLPTFRSRFLLEAINSPRGRAYIATVAKSTSGLNTINSKVLKALPVPAMAIGDQDSFLAKIAALDSARHVIDSERNRLLAMREAAAAEIFGAAE